MGNIFTGRKGKTGLLPCGKKISGVFLLFLPFFLTAYSPPRLAGQEDRHILIEQTDPLARRPGFDIAPKNLPPQPILFTLPEGTLLEVAVPSGFLSNENGTNLFGLQQGEIYRFKITHLPYAEGRELYPTLELISRLTPPAGHETEFPIPVELSEEDIRLALDGNLVTRVVYLEPPRHAIPVDTTVKQGELLTETPNSINPVAFAESRGRVMAILRVGSRIPDTQTDLAKFCFGYPPVTFPKKPENPLGYPIGYPLPENPESESETVPGTE